jgi:ribose 5-phosphate isomerase B
MEAEKNISTVGSREMMRIGIATDFDWFELKLKLIAALNAVGYELADIGAYELVAGENYPDFVVPLARVNSENGETQNQSKHKNGVVACEAANKIPGVCAALITDSFAIGQEEKDDDVYVRCLGGQVKGYSLSGKKVMTFLNADSSTSIESNQRFAKVRVLGRNYKMSERKRHLA